MPEQFNDIRDQILGQLGGGWEGLNSQSLEEAQKQLAAKTRAEAEAEAAPIAAVLLTPEGKRLLEWLARKTVFLDLQPDEQAPPSADLYALAKAKREGRDSIFALLLATLHVAGAAKLRGEGK